MYSSLQLQNLMGRADIVLNPDKFQFSQCMVNFAGFRISTTVLEHLSNYFKAIDQLTPVTERRSPTYKVGLNY